MAVREIKRKDGKSSWRAEWYPPGSDKKRTKTFGPGEKKKAEQFERSIRANVFNGVYVEPTIDRTLTLDVWFQRALDANRDISNNTRVAYEKAFRNHLSPTLGAMPIAAITRDVIVNWIGERTADGMGHPTLHACIKTLSRTLQAAVDADPQRLAKNPCTKMAKLLPRAPLGRENRRVLTGEEVLLLGTYFDERYFAMVATMGFLGLRIGEVAGLQRSDFDGAGLTVRRGCVLVNGRPTLSSTKTQKTRTVPVAPFMATILHEHMARFTEHEPTATIFTAPDGGLINTNVFGQTTFGTAVKASGLKRLTPHDLRGTAITNWLELGVLPHHVQRWAGHAHVDMTMGFYTTPTDAQTQAAVTLIEAAAPRSPAAATVTPIR
jgi:integrase